MGEFEAARSGSATPMPSQFGKYSLLGHLATGGMAEVYLARQAGLEGFEKIVVIKRIRPEITDDQMTSMFVDEARLVATLEHPNIAQVYEIGRVQDSYFFVMEFIHGGDLRAVLEASLKKKRRLALADAIYVVSHVCAALHYAHEKRGRDGQPLNLIHRDVSPSNVLISHDGAVKVCDFGIAKAHGRSAETERGVLKGKFAYMSPEQCRSEPLDRRSDIFAIGILLYEATTMSRLFKAPSDFELLRMIVETRIDKPSKRTPGYPPELERIVMRALAGNPDDRYATAQEMQLDLEAFAREHKLAMSSVNIARMMGELFEKRLDAWQTAQKEGRRLEEHLMDTAIRRESGDLPVFLPIGTSDDADISIEADTHPADRTPHRLASMEMPAVREPATRKSAPLIDERTSAPLIDAKPAAPARPRGGLWLAGVVFAGIVGAGVTVADRMMTSSGANDVRPLLQADVDKISGAIDSAQRSAHMRVDSIATTPMLRAAITTDAATMRDLSEHEYVFPIGKRESIEVFQLRKDAMVSMLHLPRDTAPIEPIDPQGTKLRVVNGALELVAAAPVASTNASVGGMLAVSTPVDLSIAKAAIAQHAVKAELAGLGAPVEITSGAAQGTPIKVAVPTSSDIGVTLELVAYPKATPKATRTWIAPVRYISFGLAGLFLLVYVARRRRS